MKWIFSDVWAGSVPTDAPPMAIPGRFWEMTNSADARRRSAKLPPWMMPKRACRADGSFPDHR